MAASLPLLPTSLVGSYPQPEWLIDRARLASRGSRRDQISIETAQSGLDLGVLADLAGKTIILGVLDLSTPHVEPSSLVAERVRRAYPFTPPERLVLAPDCGMKYLPREAADGKLRAMSAAAAQLRVERGPLAG